MFVNEQRKKPADADDYDNFLARTRLVKAASDVARASEAGVPPKAFPTELKQYELESCQDVGENARVFRFKMPNPDDEFYLPVVSTLRCEMVLNGSQMMRLYTPISPNGTKGHFDILIRHQGGEMSHKFWSLKPGDKMGFKRSPIESCYKANKYKNVVLISTGVGITPCVQILRDILSNANDHTAVTLINASREADDFLMQEEMQRLAEEHSDQFTYVPVATRASKGWQGEVGRIDADFLKRVLPAERHGTHLYICGSDRLVSQLCGVDPYILGQWSSGRGVQPGRSWHYGGGYKGVLSDLGFPKGCVTAF